jgi:peptide deformylase
VSLGVIFLQLPGAEAWPPVNPEMIERSREKIVVWDACLSFRSNFMQVQRHRAITVRYQDAGAGWHEAQASDDQNLSSFFNMKLTTSMAFSPSTGSLT